MAKTKIAILGGGMAGLSAAHHLTKTAELRARHDVAVYQLGWRARRKGGERQGQGRPQYRAWAARMVWLLRQRFLDAAGALRRAAAGGKTGGLAGRRQTAGLYAGRRPRRRRRLAILASHLAHKQRDTGGWGVAANLGPDDRDRSRVDQGIHRADRTAF